MAPQTGSTATTPTTPATASASVDVDFHILDQNGLNIPEVYHFQTKHQGLLIQMLLIIYVI